MALLTLLDRHQGKTLVIATHGTALSTIFTLLSAFLFYQRFQSDQTYFSLYDSFNL